MRRCSCAGPICPGCCRGLVKYLSHANDADTRRIAEGLAPIVTDAVDQHMALAQDTPAAAWLEVSDYSFAYTSRAAFEAEAYIWAIPRPARHGAGPARGGGSAPF